jgi:hypothetical protein
MKITDFTRTVPALGILVALGACGKAKETAASRDSTAPSGASTEVAGSLEGPTRRDSSGGMTGMSGMAGMQGMMDGAMMDSMQTQMRMMDGMSASQMKAMLPMHRQMAANMLSQMNAQMKKMNMPANTAWTATMDSVRQDLVHFPELSAQELKSAMPAHHARMTRLMQMHRDMTKNMKM